jgi:signal transduction histidine kinase
MFGFRADAPPPSRDELRAIIHTDDLAAIRASLLNATAQKRAYEGHIRIYRPDGEERTLRVSGEATVGDTPLSEGHAGMPYIQGVCLDVTESIENTRALLIAKERAEEALLLKTSLLENMSHEFRTPLTSILGYAECLQDEVAAEQQSLVSAILRGGQRLFGTLNAILDLAQLDGGSYHLILGPVETTALARQALAEVRMLAEQKQLDLRLVADGDKWVLGDHSALTRVLANLVGNAVKFTMEGSVEVQIASLGEHVSLRVVDSGVGINQEFIPHLFEEFRQESTGFSRRHEGNGLGLAITRRIVDLMGGMISVESEPGVGSAFEVLLPAVGAPAPGKRPHVRLGPETGSPELRALLPAA